MTWDTNTKKIAPPQAVATRSAEQEENKDEAPAEKPFAKKPILVFIESADDTGANDKVANIVFDNNKVILGSRFFKCVRMSAADAENDALLRDSGKKLPRIVMITPDYEIGKVVQGKVKAGDVYKAMKAVAKKSYKGNFERNVKALLKLPADYDSLNAELKVLKAKKEKGLKPNEVKKVNKKIADLEDQQKKLEERQAELLKMDLKGPKTAA